MHTMPEEHEKIPLDARLLSDAIIELNISRRNVSIYPRGHPSVEKSLTRAFEFLKKLFEIRPSITLAVAKDTLIIDDYYLDKKNPVYREFALQLSRMNIAYVTFISGLTKDELYEFHRLVSEKIMDTSFDTLKEMYKERNLTHINVGFVDFDAFSFEEGKVQKENASVELWERYIHGLLDGTLKTGDVSDVMREIPPGMLAQLLNRADPGSLKEETYDKVITAYMKKSSEKVFSSDDIKRLMEFINGLRPEIKKQFLSTTVRNISGDMDSAVKSLEGISTDEVMELMNAINEQKMAIPEALKHLLDKLSKLPQEGTDTLSLGGSFLVDDIFISPDIVNLFSGNFEAFVDSAYKNEIEKVLAYDAHGTGVPELRTIERSFSDDYIEKDFNYLLLEILSSDSVTQEEYGSFLKVVREQIEQFLWTARYGQVLTILNVLESNAEKNKYIELTNEALAYYHKPEFITQLIDSLRLLGRQMREEAWLLCDYYGGSIIAPLMNVLTEEASQTVRRFLMGLLQQFKEKTIPEATKRLGDQRWFVKRNMLYLLGECKSKEVLPYIRPYCRHEDFRVGAEATRCLLKLGDSYGVSAVRDYLNSDSREVIEMAVSLAGSFRIKELVPELIQMLSKRSISGADIYAKIPFVKALGDIGDPRSLGILKSLVSGKNILFKGAADKLKEEIYGTLRNYPYNDIQDLLRAGLKSRNEVIRLEAMRLTREEDR
jgi:hypothetical protein